MTVTQVGTTTGDAVVGTFVASLKGDTSKDTGGPDHELAKGAFHLSLNVKIP